MTDQLAGLPIPASRVVLGSVFFGTEISRETSFAVMDAYFQAGGNFIDTANGYALWLRGGVGASERTIGEWMRAHAVRDQIVLATKGAHFRPDGASGHCSREQIEEHLTQSLERLGVETVDLYWLHRDEPARPVDEIIETLAKIARSGRVRAYGASNWEPDRIEAANRYAHAHGLPPFVASQPPFSLGHVAGGPRATAAVGHREDPLRQWHICSGFPMVAYTSQSSGYFGADNVAWSKGGFSHEPPRGRDFDSPVNRRRLLNAIRLAEKKGCTAGQIALAYVLNQPFPVFAIIGTGNPDHARQALAARQVTLTEDEIASLFV